MNTRAYPVFSAIFILLNKIKSFITSKGKAKRLYTSVMSEIKEETPIVGDCLISLAQNTTYEPPYYLLPELLPTVKPEEKNVDVWDAVADSIDVENSFWRVTNPLQLECATHNADLLSEPAHDSRSSLLASLIASNRLTAAGVTSEVLDNGNFSSESIIEELENLSASAKLSSSEVAAIKTNHFINILAWLKLREINYPATVELEKKSDNVRKRPRSDTLSGMCASPDPWSDEVDKDELSGTFISGMEKNFEQKIDIINTLSHLYGRQVSSMCSRGQQTNYVVPPGTINITSPYNTLPPEKKNIFNVCEDFRWGTEDVSNSEKPSFRITIFSSASGNENETVLCVNEMCVNFGRTRGISSWKGGSVQIHVGLDAFTSEKEYISPYHLSVVGVRTSSELPDKHIQLANYGRNGVVTGGGKWILGEVIKLPVPCTIHFSRDLKVQIDFMPQ